LKSIFLPAFPLNEKQKQIALLIYYIAAFFTWGLTLLLGLGAYATAKKKQESDLASYKSEKESLEALLANLNTEIEKYSSLTQNFHKKYSI
jgi:prefoldin subunit 5